MTVPCPNCGAELAPDARSCKECGSDAATGWRPDAEEESLELPEQDYEEFLEREGLAPRRHRRGPRWFLVALVLALVAMLIWALRG